MDLDTVVLVAATAVVAVAQLGILVATRPRSLRDAGFLAVPAAASAVLLTLAWRAVAGG